MGEQIKKAISDIRKLDPEFDSTYISYRDAIAHWRNQGLWHDEMILGKSVLDWECGRGAFAVIFLELGAESVVGIDKWLDVDYATHILSRLPRATFHQMSIRDFAQTAGKDDLYDLIFANTVTEHLIDLSQQLVMCYDLLKSTGRLLINHDNYYGPLGSHDYGFLVSFQMGGTLAKVWQQLPGQKRLCPPRIALATGLFATFARVAERLRFLFYGEGNRIEFKGPQCWSDPRKCEASEQFRQSIIQRFPWTWDKQIESLMDPNDCDECPYYKRSRPWAHLIYQDDFRRTFPQVGFTTGYEKSSLNKVTTFQLRQYIIEAGFDIESWVPGMVTNEPPDSLTKPPYNFNLDELKIFVVTAVCSKSSVNCYLEHPNRGSACFLKTLHQSWNGHLEHVSSGGKGEEETMRYYPPEFTENVPAWLDTTRNVPTSTEVEQAQNIRRAFLFPDAPSPYMVDIVRAFRLLKDKQIYIEIGTYDKGNLAYTSTLLAPDAHIIDVDIVAYPEATQHLQQILQPSQRLTTIVGNSISPETVAKVRAALGSELADAIFIDGDHRADALMADYSLYAPLVKPGGYVLFHDVYWNGDEQYNGSALAIEQIDKFSPVYVIFADHPPVHRFLPWLTKHEVVWGGVGIIRTPEK